MALVSVQRNSSSETSSSCSSVPILRNIAEFKLADNDDEEECASLHHTHSNLSSSRTSKDLFRQRRVSENFFAMPGAALILPKHSILMAKNLQAVTKFGGELQTHLHAIFQHLRAQDTIKLAVRLESWVEDHRRYLVIISTTGRQDTEESIIVGCDFETRDSTTCTIGLVLPLWSGTTIMLDGDGGFHIEYRDQYVHTFKPVSVQAMWSALQSLHRCLDVTRRNNYYEGSLYLTWTCFYTSKVSSERVYINEWNFRENLITRDDYFSKPDPKRIPVEQMIRKKLKAVMMEMDLDSCTCRQIRQALESQVSMDLKEYKEYIDSEMLKVLGEMDCSSKILDYLYLGSEWNASNLEELEQLGVTHILNMTMEINNFFPNNFRYKAVRLYDEAESDLLPHWNHTWRFIEEARKIGGKCLVHCKMGISRSSATVCAYLMKSKLWSREEALKYVQSCRSIADPNPGFRRQLEEYQGILSASAHRHSKLFRSRSENDMSDSEPDDDRVTSSALSPRAAYNRSDRDGDFDLNRRLLDITNFITPQSNRAKSWSPEDGESFHHYNKYYKLSLGPLSSSDVINRYFRNKNFSEPVEFLTSSCDPTRNKKLREKRKKFFNKRAHLRRNTVAPLTLGGYVGDDLAHSEESVFVCDGFFPPRWRQEKKRSTKNKVPPSADLSSCVENQPNIPPSFPNPPTVANTNSKSSDLKIVDVCSDVNASHLSPANNDVTKRVSSEVAVKTGGIKIPTSIPVREIVAVIESPAADATKLARLASGTNLKSMGGSEFVKGHYKTASLPPETESLGSETVSPVLSRRDSSVSSTRDRSFSETQTSLSVKKIVTAIESGNLQDSDADERPIFISCNPGQAPAGERAPKNVVKADVKSHQSANTNNNNTSMLVSESNPTEKTIPSKSSFLSPFPPSILRVIEKVGLQLMRNNDGNTVTSSSSSESKASSSHGESGAKKRGVRQMVREIEKSVRKLRKSGYKTNTRSVSESLECIASPPVTYLSSVPVTALPLAAPELVDAFSPENSDVHVRDLVDRFDVSADELPASSPIKKLSFGLLSPFTQQSVGDLSSFTSPQPYRGPNLAPSTNSVTNFKSSKSVRRSQSDRSGVKYSNSRRPGYSRSFRLPRRNLYPMARSNLQSTTTFQQEGLISRNPVICNNLSTSNQFGDNAEVKSPVVREMVTDIERRFPRSLSSSSVHRSSSMPSAKPSKTSSRLRLMRERRSLRKTKSTSFLSTPWSDERSQSSD